MNTTTIEPRDFPKWKKPLDIANKTRSDVAALKRQIAAHQMSPVRLLLDDTAEPAMTVAQFLKTIPGIGPVKAYKLAKQADVPYDRKFGNRGGLPQVTARQREALADLLVAGGYDRVA